MSIDKNAQKKGAKELVDRARLHDQNAIAMIEKIRDNAKAGIAGAKSALQFIIDYIKSNPVGSATNKIGADQVLSVLKGNNPDNVNIQALCKLPQVGSADDLAAACYILACGQPITKARISAMCGELNPDALTSFQYGYENSRISKDGLNKMQVGMACAGHVFGTARKLQLVKAKKAHPGIFGYEVQWENS